MPSNNVLNKGESRKNNDYVIDNDSLIKRFNRDFLCNGVSIEDFNCVRFIEGILPSEFNSGRELFRVSRIQGRENVFLDKDNKELVVTNHAGKSRLNHFECLFNRYSQITGKHLDIKFDKFGDYSRLSDEWFKRLQANIGEIPPIVIIGSCWGIANLIGGYDFKSGSVDKEFNERLKALTSIDYSSMLRTSGEDPSRKLKKYLIEDPVFNSDFLMMYYLKRSPDKFREGFSKKINFYTDEYLEYSLLSLNGLKILNLFYPYGDQGKKIMDNLIKTEKIKEVYYIGSCGSLEPSLKLNDLVLPDFADYYGLSKSFNNFLKGSVKLIEFGPVSLKGHNCKISIVDSPFEETFSQLDKLNRQGLSVIDTEVIHLIPGDESIFFGSILYVSDEPLKGIHLSKALPSYIGWKLAAQNLLDFVKIRALNYL